MQELLLAWWSQSRADLPWRHTHDPYAILVSEVMLQQTQVSRVVPRYEAWLERWPTVEALAAASPADVITEWAGMGYNRRAVLLHRCAIAVNEMGGFPRERAELERLLGVGPYTAAAIACFAFGAQVAAPDTNAKRVLERAFGVPGLAPPPARASPQRSQRRRSRTSSLREADRPRPLRSSPRSAARGGRRRAPAGARASRARSAVRAPHGPPGRPALRRPRRRRRR